MSDSRSNRARRHAKHFELAVELIRKNRRPSNGTMTTISFSETEPYFYDICELLSHTYPFHADVSSQNRDDIIRDSLFDVARDCETEKITPDSIEKAIADNERKYRRIRRLPYYLFTQISISTETNLPSRIKVGNGTICFSSVRPKHAPSSDDYSRQLKSLKIHNDQPGWYYATIRVDARDPVEAAARAFRSVHLLRSLWNFFSQAGFRSRQSSPTQTPINPIRLGPLQTSHANVSGAAVKNWWYQSPFVAADYPGRPHTFSDEDIVFLRKQERWLLRNFKNCKYSDVLETNLVNYTIALDSPHHMEIYPDLWAVLESLSGCGADGQMNYDRLIARTANAFASPNEKKTILAHLRILRNQMIHDLRGPTTPQSMFMLLRCVHGLLFYCLSTCMQFSNISELHAFLDLPSNEEQLKSGIRLRRLKLKQLATNVENVAESDKPSQAQRRPEHVRIEGAIETGVSKTSY